MLVFMISLSTADDISTVRLRTREYLWTYLWLSSVSMASSVQQALDFVPLLNRSCYFTDLDYGNTDMTNWPTIIHAERVTIKIQALTM